MLRFTLFTAVLFVVATSAGADADLDPRHRAPARPITNSHWGVDVVDDYQYMENHHSDDVMSWVEKQQDRTRAWLDRFPHYDDVAKRIKELQYNPSANYWGAQHRGGRLFANKSQPPNELPFIVIIDDVMTGAERLLFDPMEFDDTGASAIDFFVPSPDASLVAISISKRGSEDGTLYVLDVESGELLEDVIPRVNGGTAGGDVAWTPTGDGFFYTRYPSPGERAEEDLFFFQTIWFHALGEPNGMDTYVLGESFPRIAEINFESTPDGKHVLADVSDGDGGFYEFWLHTHGEGWVKIAAFDDLVTRALFGGDDTIYLLSRKDAPKRRILRVDVDDARIAAAKVAIPEGKHAIDAFAAGGDGHVYVSEIRGGPTVVRSYDADGALIATIGEGEVATYSYPRPTPSRGRGTTFPPTPTPPSSPRSLPTPPSTSPTAW
jgi:prolyl oligopeptidase